jgi:(p)ppGpp synthase/HD superfamily hydrolase
MNAENISDYLGTRISTDTILEAKLAVAEIYKNYRIIGGVDDFLTDAGRAGTEYRAIHIQALTNDGFTFEIQVRLKDLEDLTEQSHAIYKKRKWAEKEYTDAEYKKILKDEENINKKLKAKYFEIKDKEFIKINSQDPLDFPIPIGQRFDEATGETVSLTKTARELFEEEAKTKTMLERLKDCV